MKTSFLALLLLCCGCGSTSTRREPPLPFHVAVIPFSADTVRSDAAGVASSEDALVLALDSRRVSSTIVSALDGSCCSRATLLAFPSGVDPSEFDRWSMAERDAHWVRASQDAGADLILECELRYSPSVRWKGNEKFWLNLPLFLLGGPACYFVDDVSYRAEARIQGNLYDLSAIRSERATLEDGRSQLLYVESRFQEATMDFLDRAGGNVGSFAASIVVPAGLLSRESRGVEDKLAGEVSAELAANLARAVRDGARELLVADRLAAFHLDPGYVIEVRGDRVRFRGDALLRRGEVERMESYSIRAGEHSASGEFETGTPDAEHSTLRARYVRYPFEAELPLAPGTDALVIELLAGGQSPGRRTFTLSLPAAN